MTATMAPTVKSVPADARVTFARLVRSEWIKFTSLRSTYWTTGLIMLMWFGLALIFGMTAEFIIYGPDGAGVVATAPDASALQTMTATPMTAGLILGVMVAGIQGVLVISGEYSTGMIRSSITAAPGRLSMYAAKGVVLFAWMFLLGAVSALGSYLIASPFLASKSLLAPLNGELLLVVLGAASYLGIVGLVGLGIGTFVRSGAGGIAIIVGILMVLPMVLSILSVWVEGVADIMPYLLDQAGNAMTAIPNDAVDAVLAPGIAALVACAWAAAALALGALTLKSRDA